jgi:hypothetical protein
VYTNIIKSIINIKNIEDTNLEKLYPPNSQMSENNRINSVGAALEYFIKDSYCNSFKEINKANIHSKTFSYLGNQNNPPDIMIKNGDAIEVKKLENKSSIALNSSYPKFKLYSNDSRISKSCKKSEDGWKEKDIVYSIGIVKKKYLRNLFLVYGDIYAAKREIYSRIFNIIRDAILKSDLELSPTNELGRINRIDPLGITYLRIRGMWGIEHPLNVYNYRLGNNETNNTFSLRSLMRKEKYDSFPKEDRKILENDEEIVIENVKLKDPNNPANLLCGVLIRYDRK